MIRIADIVTRLEASGLLKSPGLDQEFEVTGISDDSRHVKPGDLYCAIRGYRDDGHRYLSQAAGAGAAAALVETRDEDLDLPQVEVADTRSAAAIAAQIVFGEPAVRMTLVGVTGTNGKTTTTMVARHVLSRTGATAGLGTLGAIDPEGGRQATELTTPGPIELARRLAEFERGGASRVVMEVSSHALVQRRVDGLEFEAAVFTNLSRDHLDYHQDFDDYLAAKSRLAGLVSESGALVVNADEPAWGKLPERERTVRYSLGADADYRAEGIQCGRSGSEWTLVAPDGSAEVMLPLLGDFNVANAMAAAALGGSLGMNVEALAEAFRDVPQVPGRLEVLSSPPLVIRDYAHTPDALRRVLRAARAMADGRTIVVFGCGGERDRGKRPLMGEVAAREADFSIVTSDNPRNEDPFEIIAEIIPGLAGSNFEQIEDRRLAIERALELAGDEDVVVLAGKGHETYQLVGDERRPFDEAAIVAELRSP